MSDTQAQVSDVTTETVTENGKGTLPETASHQPEPTANRSGKRMLGFGLGGILGLLVLVWGGMTLVHTLSHESTDDAFVEGHVVAVSPRVSGHVVKLLVTDNQVVKKGDLLLEIDPRDYEQQVKQAQAMLDAAIARHKTAEHSVQLTGATGKATIRQASSGLDASRAQADASRVRLGQVRAQIANAEANLEQARAQAVAAEAEVARTTPDVKRYEGLFEKGDVSSQRLEQATAAYRTATANLEAAKKRVVAAEASLALAREEQGAAQAVLNQTNSLVGEAGGRLDQANTAPEQVAVSRAQAESANAEIAQAQAALEQAKLNLSYTRIYATEAGRVSKRTVEQGAFVSVGQALLSVVPEDVWVVANFKETQLRSMRAGQDVEVEVDSLGTALRGKVESIQAGTGAKFALLPPDNATGNFTKVVQRVPVKIVFEDSDLAKYRARITPGMSTVVSVRIK